jgi:hypothetical protein
LWLKLFGNSLVLVFVKMIESLTMDLRLRSRGFYRELLVVLNLCNL